LKRSASITVSFLAQQQVDDPATPYMLTRLAAVLEDVLVHAARFFQGISEDGKEIERSVVVDAPGQLWDGPTVPSKPSGVDGNRAKGVVDYTTEEVSATNDALIVPGRCPPCCSVRRG